MSWTIRPGKLGLRGKVIIWSFVLATLILLAVALLAFVAYQHATQDLVLNRNREVTRLSAGQMAANLNEYAGVLATLARTVDALGADTISRQASLKLARNRLAIFDGGTVILDSRGIVSAADPERSDLLGQDWSNRPFFRQILRGQSQAFSDIVREGPGGAEVIQVAAPMTGPRGEIQGVLVGMFRVGASSISAFYGGVVKLRIGEGGGAYIVDGAGRVIYHTRSELVGADFSSQTVVRQVLSGKVDALLTYDISGQDIVASYAPVPGAGWGLVSEESWSRLVAANRGSAPLLLVLLALGAIVPALVVMVSVQRITRPIQEMIVAAREVAGGKFDRRLAIHTGDELEALAEQFNVMAAELQDDYATLEQRVDRRTAQLRAANTRLEQEIAQRMRAEEALGQSETQYRQLVENSNSIILRMDPNGIVRFINQFGQDFFGYDENEIIGRNVVDTIVAPVDQNGVDLRERIEDLGRHPEKYSSSENENMRSDGERVWVAWTNRAVFDDQGRVAEILCIGLDQTEHKKAEALLAQQEQERAIAATRSRLARDLHDAVTQTLFSASLIAEVLPRIWERNNEEGRRRLSELRELTRGALAEMRTLLLELRPATLTETPLGDLLRQLGEAITGRARVPVVVSVEGQRPLPAETQVNLYRIAQEALNNVAKHSEASQATVSLLFAPSEVVLTVSDDGRGFATGAIGGDHLGLGIMQERAEAIGAILTVVSEPGRGATVTVVWKEPESEEQP